MIEDGADYFGDFDGAVYLNCAAQGPLPLTSAAAMAEAVDQKTHPNRIPDTLYFDLPNRMRSTVAPILGVRPEMVFLGPGESHGANLAAWGFPFESGDRVLIASSDFPANVYVWVTMCRVRGVDLDVVKPQRRAATTEEILDAVTPQTRVVAVSWVDYGSGETMDLEWLAQMCRQKDMFLYVDATQAAGAVPLEAESMGLSMVSAAGYKWMLGPYGTGFSAIHPDWFERIQPTYVTWTAAKGAEAFNTMPREDFEFVDTARRFDAPETAAFINMTGSAASAEFIRGQGVENIQAHNQNLLAHLEGHLPDGFRRRAKRKGGPILAVESEDAARVHQAYKRLRSAGVQVSLREDSLRVSPHIYNTLAHMDTLLEILHQ